MNARLLGRLCGAAITNDLVTIRALASRVDVNARDHNNQFAAMYAVGNDHPEALELLLAAGARPDEKDQYGNPLLHDAAPRRLSAHSSSCS